ncbi:phosphatidylserine decarboxylase proenzyme 1, mitochondrial-like [Zingiber officinale]|uniref:phosphatidylserine decarboxylase proenzyme 1, mitochondrial-like n=1 Tax=Zingiber officinale TaxID=94328 RepID=UPI001C4D2DE5|nr:phosphatidylserine decarboxylase proenzyme 1, mitochondrial-like [Zingiber officinale]
MEKDGVELGIRKLRWMKGKVMVPFDEEGNPRLLEVSVMMEMAGGWNIGDDDRNPFLSLLLPWIVSPKKGIYYCVIYLNPGDYHRVHSPVDWKILSRRHFSGHLYPTNERAIRTIRNLHIENERVVLEGQWNEGFLAIAAIGATNVGSIKLLIEPELRTNQPKTKLFPSSSPDERVYDPPGVGLTVKKGEEIAAFNMGSTVILVFQAPVSELSESNCISDFKFSVRVGDRIRVGEAIGRWGNC